MTITTNRLSTLTCKQLKALLYDYRDGLNIKPSQFEKVKASKLNKIGLMHLYRQRRLLIRDRFCRNADALVDVPAKPPVVLMKSGFLATVRSHTTSEKEYVLQVSKHGTVYCDCPGWKFSKGSSATKQCKHMEHFFGSHPGIQTAHHNATRKYQEEH